VSRLLIFTLLACLIGCERRDPTTASPFQQERYAGVLVIAIDLSGSFSEYMTEDGRAYEIVLSAVERYFRDRIGGHDMILITQLSGNASPLLWQGTPQQLRREFPDHRAFRDYLLTRADPSASRINDGVAESLNCALRSMAGSDATAVALILTDWEDTQPDQQASRERLTQALRAFSPHGAIGLYFCRQHRRPDLERLMVQCGVRHVLVEDHDRNPPLPTFD
jgi:hypothetical protein